MAKGIAEYKAEYKAEYGSEPSRKDLITFIREQAEIDDAIRVAAINEHQKDHVEQSMLSDDELKKLTAEMIKAKHSIIQAESKAEVGVAESLSSIAPHLATMSILDRMFPRKSHDLFRF